MARGLAQPAARRTAAVETPARATRRETRDVRPASVRRASAGPPALTTRDRVTAAFAARATTAPGDLAQHDLAPQPGPAGAAPEHEAEPAWTVRARMVRQARAVAGPTRSEQSPRRDPLAAGERTVRDERRRAGMAHPGGREHRVGLPTLHRTGSPSRGHPHALTRVSVDEARGRATHDRLTATPTRGPPSTSATQLDSHTGGTVVPGPGPSVHDAPAPSALVEPIPAPPSSSIDVDLRSETRPDAVPAPRAAPAVPPRADAALAGSADSAGSAGLALSEGPTARPDRERAPGALTSTRGPADGRPEGRVVDRLQESLQTPALTESLLGSVPVQGGPATPARALASAAPAAPGTLDAAVGPSSATLGLQAAEAAALGTRTVRFARQPAESSTDGATAAEGRRRRTESDGVVTGLVGTTSAFTHRLVSVALAAGPALVTAAAEARTAIDEATAVDLALVRERLRLHRRSVRARSAAALDRICEERDKALGDVADAAFRTRIELELRYRAALLTLAVSESRQLRSIHALYRSWDRGLRDVGGQVGAEAVAIGRSWATVWLAQRNGESSILDGPIHDNRLEARADAARQVAAAYRDGLRDEAGKQADAVAAGEPEVLAQVRAWADEARTGLAGHHADICGAVELARDGSVEQIESSARLLSRGIRSGGAEALAALDRQEQEQAALLWSYAQRQKEAVDRDAASAFLAISAGVATSSAAFNSALGDLLAGATTTQAPHPADAERLVDDVDAQLRPTADDLLLRVQQGAETSVAAVSGAGGDAVGAVHEIAARAWSEAEGTAAAFTVSTADAVRTVVGGYARLRRAQTTTLKQVSAAARTGFASAQDQLQNAFGSLGQTAQSGFTTAREQLRTALRGSFTDLTRQILEEAKKAADAVQPRWKKVLKAALIIVVVIAAAALTVVSAGSLGVVGTLAVGALIGGASGAAIQIGSNLIDGKKWSDGVGKAVVVGAIGGLFGGAGGLLAKGIGHAGLRLGLELGVDAVGGIVGDLAVGNPITLQGVLIGTAIGAGVGAGVGGLGALKQLKDRLRLRPGVVPTTTPTPRPDLTPPVGARPPTTTPAAGLARAPPPSPSYATAKPAGPKLAAPSPAAPSPARPAPRARPARATPEEPMVRAEASSPDGAHEVKVLRDGRIMRCSAKCQELREEFKDLLASRPGLRGRLAEIRQRAKRDPKRAAAEAAALEQELRLIRKTGGDITLEGVRFRGAEGREALARHLDAISGAGTRLSATARAEILDLADRFGKAVASGSVNRRLIGEVKALLRSLDAQHVARNPVLAACWHRALRSIAASDSKWARYLKPDGSPNWAVLRKLPPDERDATLLRLYSVARSDRTHGVNRQLGKLMGEINDAFGMLRSQVSRLPLNIEIHHLLYKARHPRHAINPWNLVLALRKSKVGQHDEMHELLHFVSMGAGMTRMGADRWNVLLDEMAAIIRKVYGI